MLSVVHTLSVGILVLVLMSIFLRPCVWHIMSLEDSVPKNVEPTNPFRGPLVDIRRAKLLSGFCFHIYNTLETLYLVQLFYTG